MKRKKWTQAEIKRNDELKAAGREAFRQGQPVESCPYESAFNQDRWSWIWGWHDEARAKKDAEEKEAAFLAEAARRGYIKAAPQAQEETRGAPAAAHDAFCRKTLRCTLPPGHDYSCWPSEDPAPAPGDRAGLAETFRGVLREYDAKSLDENEAIEEIFGAIRDFRQPQPPAPASPAGRLWLCAGCFGWKPATEAGGHLVCSSCHTSLATFQDPAAPEAGAPGTQEGPPDA